MYLNSKLQIEISYVIQLAKLLLFISLSYKKPNIIFVVSLKVQQFTDYIIVPEEEN